jgi:hypothetical protein
MIEMKTFLYILLTNFTFAETSEKIRRANVCVFLALSVRSAETLTLMAQGVDAPVCGGKVL